MELACLQGLILAHFALKVGELAAQRILLSFGYERMHAFCLAAFLSKALKRLHESVRLRLGNPVLSLVLDHFMPSRSMATIPLGLPVFLSIWKNCKNDNPSELAMTDAGNNSPMYLAF